MIQRCWRLYESYGHASPSNGPDQSDTSRHGIVYLVRLISIWYCAHCKWFMLPMTLDMPDRDEGTR
jgi:hypothetical protein